MEHRSFAPDIVVPNDDYACGNKRAGELAPDVAPEELRQEKQVGGPVNCSDSELCTFLLALEAGFLPTYYSDTNQSVQLKSMSIASRSYQHGKKKVVFHGSPSLQMSSNLTADHGKGLSMLSVEDFPARTSVSPEPERAWQGNGRAYGRKWQGLLARYDHDSRSLKTAQCSFLEDLISFLPILPHSGLMLRGECYQRPMLARRTSGSGYGFLPTPLRSWGRRGPGLSNNLESLRASLGTTLECLAVVKAVGWRWPPSFLEWIMGWPIQWTALRPLETGKFHEWQQQHSSSLPQSLSEAT